MNPWDNDTHYEDTTIKSVRRTQDGYDIVREDGWSIGLPNNCNPKAGDHIRFYGKGIGYPNRGVFINGVKVYYRTEREQEIDHQNNTYGFDAIDLLKKWDRGATIWTIELDPRGPTYEQAAQILFVALLRVLVTKGDTTSVCFGHAYLECPGDVIKKALNLAETIIEYGPVATLGNHESKFMVSKHFPTAPE